MDCKYELQGHFKEISATFACKQVDCKCVGVRGVELKQWKYEQESAIYV